MGELGQGALHQGVIGLELCHNLLRTAADAGVDLELVFREVAQEVGVARKGMGRLCEEAVLRDAQALALEPEAALEEQGPHLVVVNAKHTALSPCGLAIPSVALGYTTAILGTL